MPPALPNAVDCVSPAIDRAKWLLFKPFRWAVWWRLAIVALAVSGEAIGNMFRIPDLVRAGRHAGKQDLVAGTGIGSVMREPYMFAIIALLAFLFLLLIFVHLYVGSVLRFVLFDAVSTGQYRLRAGWRKWHARGLRLFLVQLALAAIYLAFFGVCVGLPIYLGIRSGWFDRIKDNPAPLIGLVLLAIPAILIVAVISYIITVLLFDFSIPILALEDVSGFAAFGRAWTMLKSAKGSYAGYMGMKLVLAFAIGLCIGIIHIILFFAILIPLLVVGVGITAASPDMWKNPVVIAAAVTVGAVCLLILMFVAGLFQVPVVTFLQSYAVTFLSVRYPALWNLLYPAPPQPPPAPPAIEPIAPPEPPPLPAM